MANEHRFRNDSIERTLAILTDRWTFLVVREAFFGVRRYGDFARNLGLSRNILSDRLRRLVAHGIFERRPYRVEPERFEYRLTEQGKELYPAILALLRWGDCYLSGPDGPPLTLRHRPCGEEAIPLLICSHCGEELRAAEVQPEPGPGAYTGIEGESEAEPPR